MLLIPCPYCGERSELEFHCEGESHRPRPTPSDGPSDEAWAQFLFYRNNEKALQAERWRHVHGCGKFFNVLRDTRSDRIVCSYPIGQPRPAVDEASQP